MRNTLVTTLSASMLMVASLVAMPSNAQSQVVIIIGNGSAQPYYPQPYPPPYPYPQPYPHTHTYFTAVAFTRGTATPHLTTATTMVATDTPMATTVVAIIHATDTGGGG